MEDPILDLEDEEVDVEYQTPSTSEVDIENNSTDNQSDEQNANADRYDVLTRTFRDYYMNEITETFADELDALRKKEAFFGPDRLQILSDCLAQGVNLFSQVEKELYLVEKLAPTKDQPKSDSTIQSSSTSTQLSHNAPIHSKPPTQTPAISTQKDSMDIEETIESLEKQKKEKKKKKKKHKHEQVDGITSNGSNT